MSKPTPNYFYVNRALLDSERWLLEPFTRGQAWVDLCGLAHHVDRNIRVKGVLIRVPRGSVAYSQLSLSKRWKWSREKVKRWFAELLANTDIKLCESKATNFWLIHILKYDKWQGNPTADPTADPTQSIMNKNDNNEKKKELSPNGERVRTPKMTLEDFREFWEQCARKVGKGTARRIFLRLPASLKPKIFAALELQKKSKQWQEDGGKYIPHPSTWLNREGWEDEADILSPQREKGVTYFY